METKTEFENPKLLTVTLKDGDSVVTRTEPIYRENVDVQSIDWSTHSTIEDFDRDHERCREEEARRIVYVIRRIMNTMGYSDQICDRIDLLTPDIVAKYKLTEA